MNRHRASTKLDATPNHKETPMHALLLSRRFAIPVALAFLLTGALPGMGTGVQDRSPGQTDGPAGFPDLAGALRATPGCLGVETAKTDSGKDAIFAWFEDKEAVLRWYWSEEHQSAMRAVFPASPDGSSGHEPLSEVPDEIGPILAIASITFSEGEGVIPAPFPISQISIELYTPITGGISFGGRFAPSTLVVPKRKVIVDEE